MAIAQQPERVSNDLSFARIGYNNLLTSSAAGDVTQGPLIPNTYERWTLASGTMQENFNLGTAATINYIAIGAHNLGSVGASVRVGCSTSTSGPFTTVGSATPTDDTPLFFEFDDFANAAAIVVSITGGTNREVGVLYAGQTLIMERALYGGHSPINLSSMTEYRNSLSDTGQFLGRKIRRKGQMTTFSWQYLTPTWYREYFQPFVNSAKTKPFFIKWRPDYHSDEVAFGYSTQDIKPSNMGGGVQFLSVDLNMRAHDE